jgi:hypothetical protein
MANPDSAFTGTTTISFELTIPQTWELLNGLASRRGHLDESIRIAALVLGHGPEREPILAGLRRARAEASAGELIVRRAFFAASHPATVSDEDLESPFEQVMTELDELAIRDGISPQLAQYQAEGR